MLSKLWATGCRLLLILSCVVAGYGLVVLGYRYPQCLWLLLAAIAWRRWTRRHRASDAYGSACTASVGQLQRRGWFSSSGLILGRSLAESPPKLPALFGLLNPAMPSAVACRAFLAAFVSPAWLDGRMLRLNDHVHLATFGPAGAGKSVSVLIPNLLAYRGNCVITDPKGELFKATARHRHKKFRHQIIRIDPFGVCGPGGDTLNPYDYIDASNDGLLDAARDLANMLVVRQGTDKDPHWNDSAEVNLTAFTAYVCGCETNRSQRNLGLVRRLLSSKSTYEQSIAVMCQTDACDGVISQLGGQLSWFTGEELGSVQTTLLRHTAFLSSPPILRNIACSSFDPMILRTGKASIYLILPHDRLASLAPLQRMWIGTIMRRITRGAPTEKNPVLWLLDEMGHIGHMQIIEDAVTLMRGMGMRLWFFFQSLDQLKTCFGDKAQIVLDNIGTQQFFGINSYATADEISKRIGDTTIANVSINDTDGYSQPTGNGGKDGPPSGSRSTSRSITSSDLGRRLLKPEEILTLPDNLTLIFHKNMPVIVARLLKYFSAPEFRWGRSGKQAGLGLAGAFAASVMLVASLLFATLSESLPEQETVRRALLTTAAAMQPAPRRPVPSYGGQPGPRPDTGRPPIRRVQRRRTTTQGVPGRSGHLIQIR